MVASIWTTQWSWPSSAHSFVPSSPHYTKVGRWYNGTQQKRQHVNSEGSSWKTLQLLHHSWIIQSRVSKQPCGESHMARNWHLLAIVSKEVRLPTNIHVRKPSWKRLLQPQLQPSEESDCSLHLDFLRGTEPKQSR
jgi:hypothetical protein